MQSSSRVQPFKLVLAGASPATDAVLIYDFGYTIYESLLLWQRCA
jgi:hypothetical protein